MNPVARAKNMVLTPRSEWEVAGWRNRVRRWALYRILRVMPMLGILVPFAALYAIHVLYLGLPASGPGPEQRPGEDKSLIYNIQS